MTSGTKRRTQALARVLSASVALVVSLENAALGQTFDSKSDGSDGALTLTAPGVMEFDPTALGLDSDRDGIFHFSTITVAAGVTLAFRQRVSAPVYWLASGNVRIDGTLDLDGGPGQDSAEVFSKGRIPSVPAAGGFGGGLAGTIFSQPTDGLGPGGGLRSIGSGNVGGGGGGHAKTGGDAGGGRRGPAYGNNFLLPLVGGSGGGGGAYDAGNGRGGGAGGGALLIASSTSISIGGSITADGGPSGPGPCCEIAAGGGSGGSVHLLAPALTLTGSVTATGGEGSNVFNSDGSEGRIRLEAFQLSVSGTVNPVPVTTPPFGLFLPQQAPALLRVVSVGGVAVPPNPTGSFTPADVAIENNQPVDIVLQATSIPLGTVVKVHLLVADAPDIIVDSAPLAGSLGLSTAVATATIPPGFTRGFARATWPAP